MKIRTFIFGIICVLAASVLGVRILQPYTRSFTDVAFYVLFLGDDFTVFAENYSESAFKKIRTGATEAEVLAVLGEPLRKETYKSKEYAAIWRYTKPGKNGNYWFRIILWDEHARVLRTKAKYYVD
ncbi:MAG TPA: hypothetical protein VMM36_10475 [Opitutaceae bacterium]|nr:hypothetical protein [Opitutaceae bacterium]